MVVQVNADYNQQTSLPVSESWRCTGPAQSRHSAVDISPPGTDDTAALTISAPFHALVSFGMIIPFS